MELEKATEPQLLGGLYTLRGGLSALSVKYAQVKNFDSILLPASAFACRYGGWGER